MRLVTLYAELIHSKLACASSSVPTSSILPYHSFYNPIFSSSSINPTQTSLSQSPPSSHSSFTQYSVKHVLPSLVSYTSDEESSTPNTQPAIPLIPLNLRPLPLTLNLRALPITLKLMPYLIQYPLLFMSLTSLFNIPPICYCRCHTFCIYQLCQSLIILSQLCSCP